MWTSSSQSSGKNPGGREQAREARKMGAGVEEQSNTL